MAKLSEILGGIAKDITQAQITSDLVSLEYLQQYQQDDLLKLMEVPRVKIRDIQVNLKFAIDEAQAPQLSDNAKAKVAALWGNQVKSNVIPLAIASMVEEPSKRSALTDVLVKSKKSQPVYKADRILDLSDSTTAKDTEDYVSELVKSLPSSLRKELPNLTTIRKEVNKVASQNLMATNSQLNKIAVAQSVEDFDLEIIVENDALQATPESQVHEISLSLDIDEQDIEIG